MQEDVRLLTRVVAARSLQGRGGALAKRRAALSLGGEPGRDPVLTSGYVNGAIDNAEKRKCKPRTH